MPVIERQTFSKGNGFEYLRDMINSLTKKGLNFPFKCSGGEGFNFSCQVKKEFIIKATPAEIKTDINKALFVIFFMTKPILSHKKQIVSFCKLFEIF